MATVKYSELVSEVLPVLAADPSDPVTEHAIKRAVIEFCKESWVWKYFQDPIDMIASQNTYDLEPPSGAGVAAVIRLTIGETDIDPKSPDDLDRDMPNWLSKNGSPQFYTQIDSDQVILAPAPDYNLAAGIRMTLALQPDQSANGLPGWIVNEYIYDIVDGTLAILMKMPKQEWTDMPLADDYQKKFHAAISNARADAMSALGRAPTRTTPQH